MQETRFVTRMKEIMEEKKIGCSAIAKRIKVSAAYIHHVRKGNCPPSEKLIQALADMSGEGFDELMILAGKIPEEITDIIKAIPRALFSAIRECGDWTKSDFDNNNVRITVAKV